MVGATCLLPTTVVEAQQGMAVLVGTVSDSATGKPVPDALITITSPNLQGEEIAVTDETGVYRVPGLPPGLYVLRVEAQSFRPYAREGLDLHADTTIRLNASLLPESLKAEEVVVVGRTPTVDVGSSATGLNITSDFTQRIPLIAPGGKGSAGRSFEAVADVVPGAQTDTFGTSMFGSSSPENRYLLDGLSVNNPTFGLIGTPLNIDFIKEVSVLSGGYMPEYGRSTGGILNAITKSGTNEWHGSVFTNWAPGALSGSRKVADREGGSLQTRPSLRYQGDIGGDIGGPLIKDKLWIYAGFDWAQNKYNLNSFVNTITQVPTLDGAGQPVVDDMGNPVTQPQAERIPGTRRHYVAQQDIFQHIAKLTYAADKRNRFDLSVNGVYPVSGGDGKYGVDPQSGQAEIGTQSANGLNTLNGQYNALAHKYQGQSTNVQLKWHAELDGKRMFLDSWLGYHNEIAGRLPSDGTPIGSQRGLGGVSNVWWLQTQPGLTPNLGMFDASVRDACQYNPADPTSNLCPVTGYRSGGPEFVELMRSNRLQARSVMTYLFEGLGHHVFKAGIDGEYQRQNGRRAYTGMTDYAGYDDAWVKLSYGYLSGPDTPVLLNQLHNETQGLSLGAFVQDSWNIADTVTANLGFRYDAQLLYDREGNLAMALNKQFSPRVGLIWDPTQEGHAKLYANYARYYEQVPLRMLDRYLSGEPLLQDFRDNTICNPGQPGALDPTGSCNSADSSLGYASFSNGTSLVDPKLKAPSNDELVLGGDYEVLRDGRLGLQYAMRRLTNTVEDMSSDEGTTFFFGNPGRGIGRGYPKAERKYDAATLYFTKAYSDGWLVQTSYTLSFLRGNYGGLFRADDLQFDPHQSGDFDLQSLSANKRGYLPGDNRHFLKLFAAKEVLLPGKAGFLTPGVSFRAYSGGPTNFLGAHTYYGQDQVYILPRDSGERLPWVASLDLRLAYGYQFTKTRSLSATIDVFNVFNFQSATARDQRYTTSAVNAVTDGGGLANLTNADGTPFDTSSVNPNFGRPSAYQAPRVFRFGLKGTF
jgi:hypothetical protein